MRPRRLSKRRYWLGCPREISKESELAGEKIVSILTTAPGTTNSIGGLKVVTGNGWFAARPSGTEDI